MRRSPSSSRWRPTGTVTTWTWVPEPVAGQPFDRPFAWALVHLRRRRLPDAARPRRSATRRSRPGCGSACAGPPSASGRSPTSPAFEPDELRWPTRASVETPRGTDTRAPSPASSPRSPSTTSTPPPPRSRRSSRGLAEGRLIGQRCPVCRKVYVPPRGACPVDGVPTTDEVELAGHRHVTTFCIVNVPFLGQKIAPPYVSGLRPPRRRGHRLPAPDPGDRRADEVRMGMRVEAVWRAPRGVGHHDREHRALRPTGEPDADYESVPDRTCEREDEMRDVAVVGFAQRQMTQFDGSPTWSSCWCRSSPSATSRPAGPARTSASGARGSSDYLAGRSFSFVSPRSTRSARCPPVNESHVEMDAAWALYEAWVKIQTGEVDTALVYGFGKSSARAAAPYARAPARPLHDDAAVARHRLHRRPAGTARPRRRTVGRDGRSPAVARPLAAATPRPTSAPSVAAALGRRPAGASRCTPTRCASTTIAPVTDGAAAIVLAAGDRARDACDAAGLDHRLPAPHRPAAPRRARPRPGRRRTRALGCPDLDGVDVAELHAPFSHQELILRDELGLGDDVVINPVRRRAGRQPDVQRRARPDRRGGPAGLGRHGRHGARARDQRAGSAAEPRLHLIGGDAREQAAGRRDRHRPDPPPRQARGRLDGGAVPRGDRPGAGDAGVTFDDIDAVVVGKAPDLFEGVMMPELFLADALGAVGQAAAAGAHRRLRRRVDRASSPRRWSRPACTSGCWRSRSRSSRSPTRCGRCRVPVPFVMPVHAGAGGYFAPHVRSYIRRSGAPPHIGAIVAAKDRQNALLNPYAHLRNPDITVESVLRQPDAVGPDPVRRDLPLLRRRLRRRHRRRRHRCLVTDPAWIHGTVDAQRADDRGRAGPGRTRRPGASAAATLWKQAGITDPLDEIDAAEIYVPFSWFEPMWLENLGFAEEGAGLEAHRGRRDRARRRLPVNASGGVLSSNPIGASGMLRFAEAALQVRGQAGEHQVDGVRARAGPCLRRRLAVLRDVGGRGRAAQVSRTSLRSMRRMSSEADSSGPFVDRACPASGRGCRTQWLRAPTGQSRRHRPFSVPVIRCARPRWTTSTSMPSDEVGARHPAGVSTNDWPPTSCQPTGTR